MAEHTYTISRCRLLAAPAAPTPDAALICVRQQFAEPDHDGEADQDDEASTDDDGPWWTPAMGPADCRPVQPSGIS